MQLAVQHTSCPWQSPYSTARRGSVVHLVCTPLYYCIRDRSLVAVCLQACIAAMRPFLHAARVRTEATGCQKELMRDRTHREVEILVVALISAVEYYKQGRRKDVCVLRTSN